MGADEGLIELLGRVPAIHTLDPAVLAELATHSRITSLREGETVQSDEGSRTYVIDGRAELTLRDAPVGMVGAGEFLDEACADFPAPVTVTAVTSMRLLSLPTGTPPASGLSAAARTALPCPPTANTPPTVTSPGAGVAVSP
jgi:hypothetical protein